MVLENFERAFDLKKMLETWKLETKVLGKIFQCHCTKYLKETVSLGK